MQTLLGWHILKAHGRLGYSDYRPVVVGRRMRAYDRDIANKWLYKATFPLVYPCLCVCGMHASKKIIDAMSFRRPRPGDYICRVRVSGRIYHDFIKFVGMYREVLWAVKLNETDCYNIIRYKRLRGESSVCDYVRNIAKERKITSGCLIPSGKLEYSPPACAPPVPWETIHYPEPNKGLY